MEDRPRPDNSTSARAARAAPTPATAGAARPASTRPAAAPTRTVTPRPGTDNDLPRLRDSVDLLVAVGLVVVAALARLLPEENTARLLLTLPVLVFVPGYLLIQMFVAPARTGRERAVHVLIALGASLPVIGLLALSTALVPGGFRPTPIVVVTTAACVVFAVVAYLRRWLVPTPEPAPTAA